MVGTTSTTSTATRTAFALALVLTTLAAAPRARTQSATDAVEYRVLATTKTSTMEKEMNEAADAGFRFDAVMGGDTAMGGKEVVAVMSRPPAQAHPRFTYRLLATNKTSTMQHELQQAADDGFDYRGQTVFQSTFGGREVACILERERDNQALVKYTYLLLATSKTSTMQKELQGAGDQGYEVVGLTVGKTALGGSEVVAITRRRAR